MDTPFNWSYPGARWWKCDLHNHTPASADYGKGPDQEKLKQRTPREWLLDYMRAGIDCVAVTDHNSGVWIDSLKVALAELSDEQPESYRPLVLLPGVELSIGRVHVLVLLDPDKSGSDIEAIIGVARYRGTRGHSDGTCDEDVPTIAEEVHKRGGLLIPAHADGPGGILTERQGNDIRSWLRISSIAGVELAAEMPAWKPIDGITTLPWTPVLGSDSHHPDGQGGKGNNYPGSHWTWVKMEKPGIEGLRLALVDGAMSVRRSVDPGGTVSPNTLPERMITSMEVNGTYVMGNGHPVRIGFSSWLNTIIGDRGTGKSSVVHFVRQALARNRENDFGVSGALTDGRAWKTFRSFMSVRPKGSEVGALRPDESQIVVEYLLGGMPFKIISKGDLGDHEVYSLDKDGSWGPARSQEVRDRFKATIISQGQINDLADNDRQGLLRLVDDAIDKAAWTAQWDEKLSSFYAQSARARELAVQLGQADRLKAQYEDISRKLERFEASDHAKVLRDYQRQSRQTREVKAVMDRLEAIDQALSTLHNEGFAIGDIAADAFDAASPAEQEVLTLVSKLEEAVQQAQGKVDEARKLLWHARSEVRKALDDSAWAKAVKVARQTHADLVEQLREEGVTDPAQYSSLVQQRQLVEQQLKRLHELAEEVERLMLDRMTSQRDLERLRKELIDRRCDFLSTTLQDNDYVQMDVVPFGSEKKRRKEQIRDWLDLSVETFADDVDAIHTILYDDLPKDMASRRDTFLSRLHNLKVALVDILAGADDARFTKSLKNRLQRSDRPEYKDRIETWFPEDGLALRVNVGKKGSKEWRDVDSASAGQRSAGLLAFLLSYGDEPIILDQPEDDLDNKVVFDMVVSGIRTNKARRQIIVVTHDANIVVNGDAEAVHIMKYAAGQCLRDHTASLQDDDLRERVCNIMEGGREAFQKRYNRLLETN